MSSCSGLLTRAVCADWQSAAGYQPAPANGEKGRVHRNPILSDFSSLSHRQLSAVVRVRASIVVYPADPKVKHAGWNDTSKGRPNVKISATEVGSANGFGGESDPTYIQILAEGANTSLKLVNKDGRQQVIKP